MVFLFTYFNSKNFFFFKFFKLCSYTNMLYEYFEIVFPNFRIRKKKKMLIQQYHISDNGDKLGHQILILKDIEVINANDAWNNNFGSI